MKPTKLGVAGCCPQGTTTGSDSGITVHTCCGLPPNISCTLTGSDGSTSTKTVPCGWYSLDPTLSYTVNSADPGPRFSGPIHASFGPGAGNYITGIQVADGFICCDNGGCSGGINAEGGGLYSYGALPISKTLSYSDFNGSVTLNWTQGPIDYFGNPLYPCGYYGDPINGPYLSVPYLQTAPATCGTDTINGFNYTLAPCLSYPIHDAINSTYKHFHPPVPPTDLSSAAQLCNFDSSYTCDDGGVETVHNFTIVCVEVFP